MASFRYSTQRALMYRFVSVAVLLLTHISFSAALPASGHDNDSQGVGKLTRSLLGPRAVGGKSGSRRTGNASSSGGGISGDGDDEPLSPAIIAVIVIGCVVAVAVGVLAWFLKVRKDRERKGLADSQVEEAGETSSPDGKQLSRSSTPSAELDGGGEVFRVRSPGPGAPVWS
ncbi:MAG: hypothetical protein M1817_003572 [Caeruleum heppii]|nr:MAG: hypothetical protein M1817_003572 [Caeruleum heppii]